MDEMGSGSGRGPEPDQQGERELPAANVVRRARVSPIWLIPLIALGLAGYLAWSTYNSQGSTIKISFDTGDGLAAGKTKVKFKDVDIGTVERVKIRDDLRIVATARMDPDADPYLTSGSRFWIVKPRIGTGGVSGLNTLVSGAYIAIDPGKGDPAYEFRGLEEPPQIRSDVPGHSYTLKADNLGNVTRGAPIYYRGIEVGQVLGYELADDNKNSLQISIFVRAPYDTLVHRQTHFWNASGVSVGAGANGFELKINSLQTLVTGGIEFETPPSAANAEVAQAGTEFILFPDADAASQANYTRRTLFLADFEGSGRGLHPGAAVEVRGIRIGSVDEVSLAYSEDRKRLLIRALIGIEPERVQAVDADTGKLLPPASMPELIARGLRAQLQIGNLLTGDLIVSLDFHPGLPTATPRKVGDYLLVPSVPSQLETIQASATTVLEKVANLPLDQLIQSFTATAKAVEANVASPEAKNALVAMRSTLDEVNKALGPLVGTLQSTAGDASSTLRQARATLQATERTLGPGAPLQANAQQLIEELQRAARSVRTLTDYLERHPEALLRGKSGGGS